MPSFLSSFIATLAQALPGGSTALAKGEADALRAWPKVRASRPLVTAALQAASTIAPLPKGVQALASLVEEAYMAGAVGYRPIPKGWTGGVHWGACREEKTACVERCTRNGGASLLHAGGTSGLGGVMLALTTSEGIQALRAMLTPAAPIPDAKTEEHIEEVKAKTKRIRKGKAKGEKAAPSTPSQDETPPAK